MWTVSHFPLIQLILLFQLLPTYCRLAWSSALCQCFSHSVSSQLAALTGLTRPSSSNRPEWTEMSKGATFQLFPLLKVTQSPFGDIWGVYMQIFEASLSICFHQLSIAQLHWDTVKTVAIESVFSMKTQSDNELSVTFCQNKQIFIDRICCSQQLLKLTNTGVPITSYSFWISDVSTIWLQNSCYIFL